MNGVEIVTSELPPLSPSDSNSLQSGPNSSLPPRSRVSYVRRHALFWDWNLLGCHLNRAGQQRQSSVYSTLGSNNCLILVVCKDFAATNNGQIGCFRMNSYTPGVRCRRGTAFSAEATSPGDGRTLRPAKVSTMSSWKERMAMAMSSPA